LRIAEKFLQIAVEFSDFLDVQRVTPLEAPFQCPIERRRASVMQKRQPSNMMP
jgi:hypothetical protein